MDAPYYGQRQQDGFTNRREKFRFIGSYTEPKIDTHYIGTDPGDDRGSVATRFVHCTPTASSFAWLLCECVALASESARRGRTASSRAVLTRSKDIVTTCSALAQGILNDIAIVTPHEARSALNQDAITRHRLQFLEAKDLKDVSQMYATQRHKKGYLVLELANSPGRRVVEVGKVLPAIGASANAPSRSFRSRNRTHFIAVSMGGGPVRHHIAALVLHCHAAGKGG